jgi:Flp pilus assembly pilin Flp
VRHHKSRGASSTEYALLIALIGGMLCLGIATVSRNLLNNSFCKLADALGANFCQAAPDPGPGSSSEPSSGSPQPLPSTTPSCPDPTASPTSMPTPTANPSASACPAS